MKSVFVKLGNEPTPHLWLNIKKNLRDHSSIPIVLIVNHPDGIPLDIVKQIEVHHYTASSEVDSILENLSHSKKFRNGFWRFSLERLFALFDYHSNNPEVSLLHIESDVLILRNFPWTKIASGEKIAWCRFNSERDVASLVFLPHIRETEWLKLELIKEIRKNFEVTDMQALSKIFHSNGFSHISTSTLWIS
jgi:hypothetical protein